MLIHYVQQALGLFEKADAILICDREGYIEYAKWYKDWYFSSAGKKRGNRFFTNKLMYLTIGIVIAYY